MPAIRVLIADDHTLVRAGIRSLVEAMEGMEVVAEAGDGQQAIELVQTHRPDVLLTDIAMPGLSGLDVTKRVTEEQLWTRVVIVSMHASEEYANRALQAGARGYLLKNSGAAELEIALRAVARGETYLSPAIEKYLVAEYLRSTERRASHPTSLTARQREILRLLAEGLTTKAIARQLGISTKTVETHRAQAMERLEIHDMAGLVRYAMRVGLVGPDF